MYRINRDFQVDISKYASSFANSEIPESPIKATCSSCMVKEVELHPLVRQGLIPKKIASAFVYTPPPKKSKSRSKIVSNARIVTSEEVRQEVHLIEQRSIILLCLSSFNQTWAARTKCTLLGHVQLEYTSKNMELTFFFC